MSLKITNTGGFVIGGVSNPSQTEIYVRCNVDMNRQEPIYNADVIEFISINTTAYTTVNGGTFDKKINIDGIQPGYWPNYSAGVSDMNVLYLEVEKDIKAKLEEANPTWVIEIVSIPTV